MLPSYYEVKKRSEAQALTPFQFLEKELIIVALEHFDYSRNKTSDALGMQRSTLWRKMKRYGISKKSGIKQKGKK